MTKFDVVCSEVRSFEWVVEAVEADSEEQAEAIVQQMYLDGELHMMHANEDSLDGLQIDEVRSVEEV